MTDAGGKLAISVTLRGPKFQLCTFAAGSTPPAWAQDLIKNPKAWVSAPQPAPTPEDEDLIGQTPSPAPETAPQPEANDPAQPGPEKPSEAPPEGGPGSSRAAWVAYADAWGVKYAKGASRDDIIAAVKAAPGVPSE